MALRDDPEEMRRYKREWVAARRAAFFVDKACVNCGANEGLELDHIDPTSKHPILKKYGTSSFWSWSEPRRLEEIAKCQVLCGDCHRKKTVENKEQARGERVGVSKLTEDKVREIRRLVASGMAKRAVARLFQIDDHNVRLIVARKTWAHVD